MLIEEKAFRAKINDLQNLPAFPGILEKFNEMAKDPHVSMNQIGDMVARDQMLSLKILKLVNSAFYGFPGRISTVTHALVLLGQDVVKSLILSVSAFEVMADQWRPLWRHSMAVSKACGIVCQELKVPGGEEISMAGLLHDIGKVLLIILEPDAYRTVIQAATKKGQLITSVEDRLLGFNHCNVAEWLCERWNLPQRLAAPMTFHHAPEMADYAEKQTAVVFLADNLVKAMGCGAEPTAMVEPMNPAAVELLGLTAAHIPAIVKKLEPELAALGI
jgi:putative nucleotidyltransferase with HDIG domain